MTTATPLGANVPELFGITLVEAARRLSRANPYDGGMAPGIEGPAGPFIDHVLTRANPHTADFSQLTHFGMGRGFELPRGPHD